MTALSEPFELEASPDVGAVRRRLGALAGEIGLDEARAGDASPVGLREGYNC